MATIAIPRPSYHEDVAAEAPVDAESLCPVRSQRWLAVDVDTEQKVEARITRKLTFREQLFSWLVDYNRH